MSLFKIILFQYKNANTVVNSKTMLAVVKAKQHSRIGMDGLAQSDLWTLAAFESTLLFIA